MDVLAGYFRVPRFSYSSFDVFSSHHVILPRQYDPIGPPSDEEDHLEDGAPSAVPCGFGPVSDLDCSSPLGCRWNPVRGESVTKHKPCSGSQPLPSPTTSGGSSFPAFCPGSQKVSDILNEDPLNWRTQRSDTCA
ncbi:hypothetical protein Q5P01_017718 [Channa striata]|uniref:Uncharacterized protein n=1 Tax=Channa striata TaxID=64152 RepID=A0AA88M9V7_CHASR|nr:hypothetical protein Q5P01_017718 [Channa striata]